MWGCLSIFVGAKVVVGFFRLGWWLIETTGIGARTSVRAVWICSRLRLLTAETLTCPRHHEEAAFGVWECQGCHAAFEGWAFQKCPICALGARWFECSQCGLPVKHPVPELL